jgi:hypothetical protein
LFVWLEPQTRVVVVAGLALAVLVLLAALASSSFATPSASHNFLE